MNFMSETAFEAVISPDNKESPFDIWAQIIRRYASTSVNNKGCVWLKFIWYEFKGNFKEFITDMNRMLTEIALVKLGVPDNILSFSILAKLNEDLWNVIDNIIMNEVIVESPQATLSKLQEIVHLEESQKSKNATASSATKTSEDQPESASALIHESKKSKQEYLNAKANPPPTAQLVEANNDHQSVVSLLLTESQSKPIVLDSGATHHIVNNPDFFNPVAETNIKISTGGHSKFLSATAVGTSTLVNHLGEKLVLENVLLVPSLNQSLISIPRLFNRTLLVTKFENHSVVVNIDDCSNLLGTMKNNLLELLPSTKFEVINPTSSCYLAGPNRPDWHLRLGHPNPKYQKELVPDSITSECDICKMCKHKALPFVSRFKPVNNVLEAVHLDLVGPFPVRTASSFLYFLTIVDQFSGFWTVKFLKHKFDAFKNFVEFKTAAEKQTGRVLCTIISDGGGEFINQDLKNLCASEGISHHIAPPYTPQNNGMAKKTNQTIIVKARFLLVQSKLLQSFWAKAVNTATQLSNLTPSSTRQMKIPYTTWTGRDASLDILRPFGSLAYMLIPKEQRTFKLFPTAEKGIMLGYENNFLSYHIYNLDEKRVVRDRNVKFDEDVFPGLKDTNQNSSTSDVFDEIAPNLSNLSDPSSDAPSKTPCETAPLNAEPTRVSRGPKEISSDISPDNILLVDRRGNAVVVYLTEQANNTPKSYVQAINSPASSFWKKAIEKEISNMYDHDVWIIVQKPGNQKAINCTWVFKVKKNQLNVPIEYKARLCAKGFQQTKGTDYNKTYALTGKLVSLRMPNLTKSSARRPGGENPHRGYAPPGTVPWTYELAALVGVSGFANHPFFNVP
ncbi:hypothetical protein PCASD_21002 [Puccinia coronata f. sp. avenae]|uniref:Integrase catalytic domain-containing protein n=1 Tax=Puccinia coronata f. sp. avenae TaxID=200324 RepID=A0A2N5TQ24_9BASI|nr:hypothetical protein PCASD_21002 [Puccinia coronata f. sp. avenae]